MYLLEVVYLHSITTTSNALLQPIKYFYNVTYESRSGTPVSEGYLTFLWSLTTAIFIPGGMIGSFLGGWLADKLGRLVCVVTCQYQLFTLPQIETMLSEKAT